MGTVTNTAADYARLGEAVRERRQRRRLTQDELADRAGVSSRTLIDLEAGKRTKYRDGSLIRVSQALGWASDTWKDILAGKPAPADPPQTTDISDEVRGLTIIASHWGELPEHTRRILLDIAEREMDRLHAAREQRVNER